MLCSGLTGFEAGSRIYPMKAFMHFMVVSLVLSLVVATGTSLNAKPVDPKTTEEYTNLLAIIKAYQKGMPATVRDLQTEGGKKLCDLLYTKPWLSALPEPEVTELKDASFTSYFRTVHQHHLIFIYHNSEKSPTGISQLAASFFLENGKWRFHDIIAATSKGDQINLSSLNSDNIDLLPRVDFKAIPVVSAAKKLMNIPARNFDDLKMAIADFQVEASVNGFADRKEVQHFTDAANQMQAFGTRWNQTLEKTLNMNISSMLHNNIDVHGEASGHTIGIMPTGSASGSFSFKNEFELKAYLEKNIKQIVNALSQQDADEYANKSKRLSDAYSEILSLGYRKAL